MTRGELERYVRAYARPGTVAALLSVVDSYTASEWRLIAERRAVLASAQVQPVVVARASEQQLREAHAQAQQYRQMGESIPFRVRALETEYWRRRKHWQALARQRRDGVA